MNFEGANPLCDTPDESMGKMPIFGGKLRTASSGEFVLAGIAAFLAFVVLGSSQIDTSGRG